MKSEIVSHSINFIANARDLKENAFCEKIIGVLQI